MAYIEVILALPVFVGLSLLTAAVFTVVMNRINPKEHFRPKWRVYVITGIVTWIMWTYRYYQ